jgi:hypothetical protein
VNPSEFIMRLTPSAVESQRKLGVPASITIAQAALESGWGESGLARAGNNLFGIKADTPKLLAETDARMLHELTVSAYFKYIFMTVGGKGAGDVVKAK